MELREQRCERTGQQVHPTQVTRPPVRTTKAGLSKVRIYFSGDELWERTKFKDGYDPEFGEASNNTFPFSRQLTFGLDLTF